MTNYINPSASGYSGLFFQINREDIGWPRGKFSSSRLSWKNLPRYRIANLPRAFLITIQVQASGRNKGKKFFSSSRCAQLTPSVGALPRNPTPRRRRFQREGVWVDEFHRYRVAPPILQTGKLLSRPQNPSTERAYFHLTRLNDRLILLKTLVTWFCSSFSRLYGRKSFFSAPLLRLLAIPDCSPRGICANTGVRADKGMCTRGGLKIPCEAGAVLFGPRVKWFDLFI